MIYGLYRVSLKKVNRGDETKETKYIYMLGCCKNLKELSWSGIHCASLAFVVTFLNVSFTDESFIILPSDAGQRVFPFHIRKR